MLFSTIARLAAVELHVGMNPPKAERPTGLPVKVISMDSGWSESVLRKWAKLGLIDSERFGGRLFVDAKSVPTR